MQRTFRLVDTAVNYNDYNDDIMNDWKDFYEKISLAQRPPGNRYLPAETAPVKILFVLVQAMEISLQGVCHPL